MGHRTMWRASALGAPHRGAHRTPHRRRSIGQAGVRSRRSRAAWDQGDAGLEGLSSRRVPTIVLAIAAPSSLRTTRRLSKASPGACPGAFSGRYDAYQLPTNPGGVLSRRRKGARVAALVPPVVCFVGDGREDPMIADDKWPVARLIPISSASGVEAQERRLASALRAVDVQ